MHFLSLHGIETNFGASKLVTHFRLNFALAAGTKFSNDHMIWNF